MGVSDGVSEPQGGGGRYSSLEHISNDLTSPVDTGMYLWKGTTVVIFTESVFKLLTCRSICVLACIHGKGFSARIREF